jgi:hypothetical protein
VEQTADFEIDRALRAFLSSCDDLLQRLPFKAQAQRRRGRGGTALLTSARGIAALSAHAEALYDHLA